MLLHEFLALIPECVQVDIARINTFSERKALFGNYVITIKFMGNSEVLRFDDFRIDRPSLSEQILRSQLEQAIKWVMNPRSKPGPQLMEMDLDGLKFTPVTKKSYDGSKVNPLQIDEVGQWPQFNPNPDISHIQ